MPKSTTFRKNCSPHWSWQSPPGLPKFAACGADFAGSERVSDGVKIALNLPAKRSNWTACDWKVCKPDAPLKLDGDAIRVVERPGGAAGRPLKSEAGWGLPTTTLFIVDVSSSMDGPSIRQARRALLGEAGRAR